LNPATELKADNGSKSATVPADWILWNFKWFVYCSA